MQKIYCYVDESGQDTLAQPGRNQLFVVAVVVAGQNWSDLQKICEDYEHSSGKGRKKWNKTRGQHRFAYIYSIVNDKHFVGAVYYSASQHLSQPDFDNLTTSTIARVLHIKEKEESYTAEVYIDGISRKKQADYSVELRRWKTKVRRVHRVRDESNALVRLADTMAGLIRTGLENQDQEMVKVVRQAIQKGIITEI